MEDAKIIELYNARNEQAIAETEHKFGSMLFSVAMNILCSKEDSEETVNDTYGKAWNNIPPLAPLSLGAWLGKITRNLSISRWRKNRAQKRSGMEIMLSELEECIAAAGGVERQIDEKLFLSAVNDFLLSQPKEKRNIFIRRYWYLCSVSELSESYGISESKVKSLLFRMRNQLRKKLEEEDFI